MLEIKSLMKTEVVLKLKILEDVAQKAQFNENRGCIEIFFSSPPFNLPKRLMKTEVVLKLVKKQLL